MLKFISLNIVIFSKIETYTLHFKSINRINESNNGKYEDQSLNNIRKQKENSIKIKHIV